MPNSLALEDFPQVFGPFYKKRCKLAGATDFARYDFLVPNNAGTYVPAADNAVLTTGYVIALQEFYSGMTEVEIALPGSVVPCEVDLPGGQNLASGGNIKLHVAGNETFIRPCPAADVAAGRCAGRIRMRILAGEEKMCRAFADGDLATVHTGVL